MRNKLNALELCTMFRHVARRIIEMEPFLTEIDLKIGDGDHGIGMATGFKGVLEQLDEKDCGSVQDVFKNVGTILLDTMGGASGVIFGTMFISGILPEEKTEEAGLADFACIFDRSLAAIKKRGRARVGDKTMVDALEPAVNGLKSAADNGMALKDGMLLAAEEARKGVDYTKEVRARFGRAKYYGDKAIGLQDAGATSVWIIFDEMAKWIIDYFDSEETI